MSGKEKNPWSEGYLTGCKIIYYESNSALDGRKNCFIAENAVLTGDCILGDDCSIWYSAVLRSDVDAIRCGNRVNVQDCACIHQTGTMPCILEDDVSVGHGAIVHGATVRKGALIGMNATVLDKADIGEGAIIAAGAVVTHGTKVPAHEIWAGIPAKKVKACAPGQAEACVPTRLSASSTTANTPALPTTGRMPSV